MDILIMGVGAGMLMPLLGNYMLNYRMMSAVLVGYVTGFKMVSQDVMMLFGGIIGDRAGCRQTMAIGSFVRALGFLLFGLLTSFEGYMAAGFFSGFGGALFVPATYAFYAGFSNEQNRTHMYSLREVMNNMGNIVGPVIGSFLFQFNFTLVCIASACAYTFVGIVTLFYLPNISISQNKESIAQTIKTCIKNTRYIAFLFVIVLLAMLNSQLNLAIPVRIKAVDPKYMNVGIIYTVSAIIGVALQMPVVRFIKNNISNYTALAVSTLLYAGGLFVMGLIPTIWSIYLGTMIFTFGKIIYQPIKNMAVADYAEEGKISSYFGFQGLALALGSFVGNVAGGYMYDISETPAFKYLPWIVWMALGIAVAAFFMSKGFGKSKT